jgi:outer membrane protein assembly factor BamD
MILLLLTAAAVMGAKSKDESSKEKWEKFKNSLLWKDEETEVQPLDEMFEKAELNFHGKPTWFGKPRKNFSVAKDLYKKVVENYPFSREAIIAELRVADCAYEMEEYEEAALWYEQFVKKHARHEDTPYAMFQQGMCNYKRKLKPGRDPNYTREAIVAFELMRERFPDSPYAEEARDKIRECREDLAKMELGVGDYYFKRKEFWSAAARYHGVYEKYPGLGFDEEAMFKEGHCYEMLGKNDLARALYEKVGPDTGKGKKNYGKKAADRLKALDKGPGKEKGRKEPR